MEGPEIGGEGRGAFSLHGYAGRRLDAAQHDARIGELCTPPPRSQTKDVMLGRVGNTREIANATLFFACEESSYCTATHLMVDGGQTPCTIME